MRTPAHVLDYYADLEADEQALTGRLPDEFYVASGPHITTRRRDSAPGHDHPDRRSES